MLLTIHSAQNLPTGGLCMMYLGETALTSSAQEDSEWATHKSFHTKWQSPSATGANVVWNQRYSVGVKRPSVEVLTVRIKSRTMETLITTAIPLKQFTFDQNVVSVAPLFNQRQSVGNLHFEVHIMYNNHSKTPEPPRPTRAASCPPSYHPSFPPYRPPPPSYLPPQPVRQNTVSPAVAVEAATGLAHLLSAVDPTGFSRMLPVAAAMLSSRSNQRSNSSGSIPASSHQNPQQSPLVDYFMTQGRSDNYDPNGAIFASVLQQHNAKFSSGTSGLSQGLESGTSSLFQGLDGNNGLFQGLDGNNGNGYTNADYSGYDYTGGGNYSGGYYSY